MISIASETLLSLSQAARLRPLGRKGRPTHISTVYRWVTKGFRGITLESIRLGGTLYTSVQAVQRFADRLTDADSKNRCPPIRANVRQRQMEAVDAELRELGL